MQPLTELVDKLKNLSLFEKLEISTDLRFYRCQGDSETLSKISLNAVPLRLANISFPVHFLYSRLDTYHTFPAHLSVSSELSSGTQVPDHTNGKRIGQRIFQKYVEIFQQCNYFCAKSLI